MNAVERFFMKLPGGSSPEGRAAWAGLTGGAIMWGVKPGFAFNKDGTEKPWILFNQDAPPGVATAFPAWMAIVLPGIIFGWFV